MHILGWIVFGAIVGWLANGIMGKRGSGCLVNIALGLVGALAGGFLFQELSGRLRLRPARLHRLDPGGGDRRHHRAGGLERHHRPPAAACKHTAQPSISCVRICFRPWCPLHYSGRSQRPPGGTRHQSPDRYLSAASSYSATGATLVTRQRLAGPPKVQIARQSIARARSQRVRECSATKNVAIDMDAGGAEHARRVVGAKWRCGPGLHAGQDGRAIVLVLRIAGIDAELILAPSAATASFRRRHAADMEQVRQSSSPGYATRWRAAHRALRIFSVMVPSAPIRAVPKLRRTAAILL